MQQVDAEILDELSMKERSWARPVTRAFATPWGMELQAPTEETIIEVAVAHLDRRFPAVDRESIDATVRRVVHELLEGARVKSFIGVLAERRVRTELEGAAA